ncbi:MAG: DUF3616 domain-containing protein [Paracoccus sp. (in: a-proteobacteria)]|uniref:DUF3616 domain-containing protein n=1 Tax=Paracoccus sp. TaxID=267 RepID=UPI0026DF77FD|nr:DUF3616 domain-containing protein [Paracoccus sp. (in: a-proteobacteria)]MDO5611615.1 DUF3616 domain-containing protein [Paracoccus sp. (in: a-proteobacteria)]
MAKNRKKKLSDLADEFDTLSAAAGFETDDGFDDKNDKDDKADKQKPLGTAKAVETMFRNAVRSEMDMIALAATKANIMISLNGLIISALMISGAFIFANSAAFLLPAGVFMATAACSIIFALLAASPERVHYLRGLADWVRALRRGEAGLRDLRTYMDRANQMHEDHDLNLLIYEDRVRMTPDDYWDRMQALLRDRDDIYRKMSDQLYWLGLMADRKFKMLNVSYTVFRWGLLISVIAFVGIKSAFGLFPGLTGQPQLPQLRNLGISEFRDIYEPSAVQQLPDGRILVVEDEASRALSLMSIGTDGTLVEDPAADVRLTRAFGRRLNDLEGLSVDDHGFIYAITSHSANADGQRRADREQMLRFRIEGNHVGQITSYTHMRDALDGATELKARVQEMTGEEIDFAGLNIEGLAFHRQTQNLMLGLREPLVAGRSLIVTIRNPNEVFAGIAPPAFGDPIVLDMQGGGIRALSFDPVIGAFLIVNEIRDEDGKNHSQLWSWSGDPADEPAMVDLPDIINLNNVESIDSITINGESRLLLMSDEGNQKKGRPAKYMMLDYAQIGH